MKKQKKGGQVDEQCINPETPYRGESRTVVRLMAGQHFMGLDR